MALGVAADRKSSPIISACINAPTTVCPHSHFPTLLRPFLPPPLPACMSAASAASKCPLALLPCATTSQSTPAMLQRRCSNTCLP